MGQMRFLAPQRDRMPCDAETRAYVAGMECIPWLSRNVWAGEQLVIDREVSESGNLYIPWNVCGHGELVLSTTCLMERIEPYHLPVELARGTLNRIRNQLAAWRPQGLKTSAEFQQSLDAAMAAFVRAAVSQHEPGAAAAAAEESIHHGVSAINQLGRDYVEQVLALRHQQTPKLATLLAGRLDAGPIAAHQAQAFLTAFNAAVVPIDWGDVELNEGDYQWNRVDTQLNWCRANGLKVIGGPLLRIDKGCIPDWLYLWEDDFDSIRSCLLQYIAAVVGRYHGKVHIWHCAAGMNLDGAINLSEEQKLRLTVNAIETVHNADPRAPVVVSFAQPWAEYMAQQDYDLSPLHFADSLIRADLGVAGVGLEINLGYWPGGTLPREPLEISRMIDIWSQFGLPLLVMLTIPSSPAADPTARNAAQPIAGTAPNLPSLESQRALAEQLIPLLISKQSVHAVVWNQLTDTGSHDFAHGGLFDGKRTPKPVLEILQAVRRNHLA